MIRKHWLCRLSTLGVAWMGLGNLAIAQTPPAPVPAPAAQPPAAQAPTAQPPAVQPGAPAAQVPSPAAQPPAPGQPPAPAQPPAAGQPVPGTGPIAPQAAPGGAPPVPAEVAALEAALAAAKPELIKERFPDGAVAVERNVVRDPKGNYLNHGWWKGYYPDGRLMGEGEYLAGKRHGKWTRWYAPGEAPMFNSPLYGPNAWYFSEAYFDRGVLHGPWIVDDANKQILSSWEFKAGKQDGPWMWFYPSGAKRREATYVAGAIVGEAINYAQDGKVLDKEIYIDGREKVFREEYYRPNVKSWEGWYLLAKPITKTYYDWWYGRAETVVTGQWGKDEKHGLWTWWYPNGQKQAEGKFLHGAYDGPWVWWHPNGQKWIEGTYVAGKQSGPWSWWRPDGAVEKQQAFAVVTPPAPAIDPAASPVPGAGGPAPAVTPATPGGLAPAPLPAAVPGGSAPTNPPPAGTAPGAAPPGGTPPAAAPPAGAPPAANPPAGAGPAGTAPAASPPATAPQAAPSAPAAQPESAFPPGPAQSPANA